MPNLTERTAMYAFNNTKGAILATQVKVANTHASRLIGLIRETSTTFTAGRALWIVPCRCVHTIGMDFAIDVLFLDKANRVIHLEVDVKPWRMTRLCTHASSVLELPSRTLWRTGTTVGDTIEITQKEVPNA